MIYVLYVFLGIIGLILAVILLNFLFLAVITLFVKNINYKKNSKFFRKILNFYTFFAIKFSGVRLHVEGLEKIDKTKRFLLVSNHISNFDPILTWYAFKKYDLAFLSKPENFKVPFFNKIVRKCCFMPIDRENPKNAIYTIIKSAELIKNDVVSIGVYPEGTRNFTNETLLPFHDGVLKIASKSNVSIVVLTVKNTPKIKKNFLKRKTDVYLNVIDVIDAETVKNTSSHELSDNIKNNMLKDLSLGDKDV